MRRLLEQLPDADRSSTGDALAVIERFDSLTSEEAQLGALLDAASELTRADVAVHDVLNGRFEVVVVDPSHLGDGLEDFLSSPELTQDLTHEGSVVEFDGAKVVVASIDAGTGHIGVACLSGRDGLGEIQDLLVAERLAAAVAVDSLRRRAVAQSDARIDPASIERLLMGDVPPEEAAYLARRARLPLDRQYLVMALEEVAPRVHAPDVLAEAAFRALKDHHVPGRACIIDRRPVVVAEQGKGLDAVIAELSDDPAFLNLRIGLGSSQSIGSISHSHAEAVDALLLGDAVGLSGAIASDEIGIWRLLLKIPREEIMETADVKAVSALCGTQGDLADRDLLRTFCAAGSLRKTAAQVHLHHSSVQYRIRRIEAALSFDLTTPAGRDRAMFALRLLAGAEAARDPR